MMSLRLSDENQSENISDLDLCSVSFLFLFYSVHSVEQLTLHKRALVLLAISLHLNIAERSKGPVTEL